MRAGCIWTVRILSFSGTAFTFGVWFIGKIFMSSWQFFEFLCLEGCIALTEAFTPPNSLGYISISWWPEAAGISTFYVAVSLVSFMLHVGLAGLLCAIYGATVNTLVEDGDRANTFCVFNPTQAEQTYSMVAANQFCSQIFGVAILHNHSYCSWLSRCKLSFCGFTVRPLCLVQHGWHFWGCSDRARNPLTFFGLGLDYLGIFHPALTWLDGVYTSGSAMGRVHLILHLTWWAAGKKKPRIIEFR